jgi:hypothetical protein
MSTEGLLCIWLVALVKPANHPYHSYATHEIFDERVEYDGDYRS